jgi:serine/threonine protein kinase
MREGRIMAKVHHSGILKLSSFGLQDDQVPYLVIEFFEGKSLREVLAATGTLDPERILRIGTQVCKAMEVAHSAGIIHRDISLANIMLQDGQDDKVKVIDFGFSRLSENSSPTLTETGTVLGSLYFMSPEQFRSAKVDQRSDIYSLGCVLYALVSGSPPFDAENPIGFWQKHATQPPDPLPRHLPEGMERAIFKALSKTPEDRYQSMQQFGEALQLVLTGNGAELESTAADAARERPLQKSLIVQSAAIAVFLLICGLVAWRLTHNDTKNEHSVASSIVLRRLRSPDELKNLPADQRVPYLNQWLSQNQGDSLDSARALFLLGEEVQKADLVAARTHWQNAANMTIRSVQESYANGRNRDLFALANLLSSIHKHLNDSNLKLEQFNLILSLWKNRNERGTIAAMNVCRTNLAEQLIKDQRYREAEPLLNEAISSLEKCSVTYEDQLQWMLLKAKCSIALNDPMLSKELDGAMSLALSRRVPQGPFLKEDLAKLLTKAHRFDDARKVYENAEADVQQRLGRDFGVLRSLLLGHTYLLIEMHQAQKAFDLLETGLSPQNVLDRMEMVSMMALADSKGNLGKSKVVIKEVSKIVSSVPHPLEGTALVAILNGGETTTCRYDQPSQAGISQNILRRLFQLRRKWKLDEVTSTIAMEFTDNFARAGLEEERAEMVAAVWEKFAKTSGTLPLLCGLFQRSSVALLKQHRTEPALSIYRAILSSAGDTARLPVPIARQVFQAKTKYAGYLFQEKQTEEALALLKECQDQCRQHGIADQRLHVTLLRASYYGRSGRQDQTERLCKEVLDDPEATSDQRLGAMIPLTFIYERRPDAKSLATVLQKLVQVAQSEKQKQIVRELFERTLQRKKRIEQPEIAALFQEYSKRLK